MLKDIKHYNIYHVCSHYTVNSAKKISRIFFQDSKIITYFNIGVTFTVL